MPTLSQLSKRGRKRKIKKSRSGALRRIFNAKDRVYKSTVSPQKRGVVTLVKTMTPKNERSTLKRCLFTMFILYHILTTPLFCG